MLIQSLGAVWPQFPHLLNGVNVGPDSLGPSEGALILMRHQLSSFSKTLQTLRMMEVGVGGKLGVSVGPPAAIVSPGVRAEQRVGSHPWQGPRPWKCQLRRQGSWSHLENWPMEVVRGSSPAWPGCEGRSPGVEPPGPSAVRRLVQTRVQAPICWADGTVSAGSWRGGPALELLCVRPRGVS